VYMCGDSDGNTAISILDISFLIRYIYKNGQIPDPPQAGDSDGNGITNLLDVLYLINYLYKSGPEPLCP